LKINYFKHFNGILRFIANITWPSCDYALVYSQKICCNVCTYLTQIWHKRNINVFVCHTTLSTY